MLLLHAIGLQYGKSVEGYFLKRSEDRQIVSEDREIVPEDRQTDSEGQIVSEDREIIPEDPPNNF